MATANPKTAAKAKAAGPSTKGIQVIARPATFRRAGYAFSAEPTVIPLSDLTDDQLELLRNEPQLVCQDVDIPAPAEAEAEAK